MPSRSSKTILGAPPEPATYYFKTLSEDQRDDLAKWIIERMSPLSPTEIVEVLKRARKLVAGIATSPPDGAVVFEAPKKKRGKPGKWVGVQGKMMTHELDAFLSGHPEMTQAQAIAHLAANVWQKRFPQKIDIERRIFDALAKHRSGPPSRKRTIKKK